MFGRLHRSRPNLFSLQLGSIPVSQRGSSVVRRLEKSHQIPSAMVRAANRFVGKDEHAQVRVVAGGGGQNLRPVEPLRFRGGVGVKRRLGNAASSRPEAVADHFVRIGFTSHGIGIRTFRGALPGKAREGKIEAPPKEVKWTALA